MPYHHLLIILLLGLLNLSPTTTSQPSPPSDDNYGSPLPTSTIIIVVVIVFASSLTCYLRQFVTCFRVYVFGGTEDGGQNNNNVEVRRRDDSRGLDPKVLATFPIFLYSDVKVHLINKTTPLECAVCLCEFVDQEQLRLLPGCSHVFHPDCIAPWLVNNVTCPLCRANLEIQVDDKSVPQSLAEVLRLPLGEDHSEPSDQIVQSTDAGDDPRERDVIVHVGSSPVTVTKSPTLHTPNYAVGECREFEFLPRSHSTGHSILIEDRERFTLRLPEEVRNKLVNVSSLSGVPVTIVSPRTQGYRARRSNSCATIQGKPDQWRFTMSPPFISRSGSTSVVEGSNSNNNNNNNNNIGVLMRSPRSFFKAMKSPSKSPLNRVVRCDDIGERSSDKLWPNRPTSQELGLQDH